MQPIFRRVPRAGRSGQALRDGLRRASRRRGRGVRRPARHPRALLRDAAGDGRAARAERDDVADASHRRGAQLGQRDHRAETSLLRAGEREDARAAAAHLRRDQAADHRFHAEQRPREAAREAAPRRRLALGVGARGDVGREAAGAGGPVPRGRRVDARRHRPHGARDGFRRRRHRHQLRFPRVPARVHSQDRTQRQSGAARRGGDAVHGGGRGTRGSPRDRQRDEEQRMQRPGLDAASRGERRQERREEEEEAEGREGG
mmetsp:Transcript_5889/g.21477  ORF Transcript_5889/g.21477 Transcript_5889/m.21477 type:complete len:260 (+) Transcript_5889:389-1168(+)